MFCCSFFKSKPKIQCYPINACKAIAEGIISSFLITSGTFQTWMYFLSRDSESDNQIINNYINFSSSAAGIIMSLLLLSSGLSLGGTLLFKLGKQYRNTMIYNALIKQEEQLDILDRDQIFKLNDEIEIRTKTEGKTPDQILRDKFAEARRKIRDLPLSLDEDHLSIFEGLLIDAFFECSEEGKRLTV